MGAKKNSILKRGSKNNTPIVFAACYWLECCKKWRRSRSWPYGWFSWCGQAEQRWNLGPATCWNKNKKPFNHQAFRPKLGNSKFNVCVFIPPHPLANPGVTYGDIATRLTYELAKSGHQLFVAWEGHLKTGTMWGVGSSWCWDVGVRSSPRLFSCHEQSGVMG